MRELHRPHPPARSCWRWRTVWGLVALLLVAGSPAADAAVQWPDLSKPVQTGGGEKDAAVVAAIERYSESLVPRVPGARRNAIDWFGQLTKGRGIPDARVKLIVDDEVTRDDLLEAAREAARQVQEGGTLWFVFIGHGAPWPATKDALLVGYDAQQKAKSLLRRSVRRKELLRVLAQSKARRTVVVLDTCFSGQTAQGKPLVKGLQPITGEIPADAVRKGMALLTAAKNNQFAGQLPGAKRPAFSYLVLGGLRGWADDKRHGGDGDGKVSPRELLAYAQHTLRTLLTDRSQTPTLATRGDEAAATAPLGPATEKQGPDLALLRAALVAATPSLPGPATGPTGPTTAPSAGDDVVGRYLKGCDGGDMDACWRLGDIYAEGRGRSRDHMRALMYYRIACVKGGSKVGCQRLGSVYLMGRGVEKDVRKAIGAFGRSCKSGNPAGCTWLGRIYASRQIQRYREAASFFEQGCKGGGLMGCNYLGTLLLAGLGVPKDVKRAAMLFRRACTGEKWEACTHLAYAYEKGRGVAPDHGKAAGLYRRACERGVMIGCTDLARLYQKGLGVPVRDLDQALELRRKACRRRFAPGCRLVGEMYQRGVGVPASAQRAASYYERACSGRDPLGCLLLGSLYRRGSATLRADRFEAMAYYNKACRLGEKRGCKLRDRLGGRERSAAVRAPALRDSVRREPSRSTYRRDPWRRERWRTGSSPRLSSRAWRTYYERACGRGQKWACERLRQRKRQRTRSLKFSSSQLSSGLRRLAAGCRDGLGRSCYTLGLFYASGLGVRRNRARARILYRRACLKRHVRACRKLGDIYAYGRGIVRIPSLARTYYTKACIYGDRDACRLRRRVGRRSTVASRFLGTRTYRRRTYRPRYPKTRRYAPRSSTQAKGWSDDVFGDEEESDQAVVPGRVPDHRPRYRVRPRLYPRRVETRRRYDRTLRAPSTRSSGAGDSVWDLRSRCQSGSAKACHSVALRYELGRGVRRSVERAVPFYDTACSAGQSQACFRLGELYETGRGVRRANPAKARDYFTRACSGGLREACRKVAF